MPDQSENGTDSRADPKSCRIISLRGPTVIHRIRTRDHVGQCIGYTQIHDGQHHNSRADGDPYAVLQGPEITNRERESYSIDQ